jgi:putative oxidoreductase
VFKGGWEYVVLLALIAAAMVSIGPGRWSIDAALGWHLAGPGWAGLAIVVGVAAAAGLLATIRRDSPTNVRPAEKTVA